MQSVGLTQAVEERGVRIALQTIPHPPQKARILSLPTLSQDSKKVTEKCCRVYAKVCGDSRKGGVTFRALLTERMEAGVMRQDVGL